MYMSWYQRHGETTCPATCITVLTLNYPPHFACWKYQSGVNHIYEGWNNCESRQVIYHCKEECLSFIQKQTEIQLYKLYVNYAHEY